MLQTVLELTLITVTIYPCVHSITICFAEFPLTDVWVALCTFPHPRPVLHTVQPFPLVKLPIWPCVPSNSLWLTVDIKSFVRYKITFIKCAISKFLNTFAMLVIILPLSLINPKFMITLLNVVQLHRNIISVNDDWNSLIINHNSFPMSLPINKLPIIHRLFILFQL